MSKKRSFSKEHNALIPIFYKKRSTLPKAKWSHVIFFKFIIKNSLLPCEYLVKNTSILLKLYYIMGQKSQQGALFLRFFTKKLLLSCAFRSKNVHSLKKTLSHAHILSEKRPFSQKQSALMSIFFKIFMKNPLLSRPYLVKKRQLSQKYIIIWPNKSMPFFQIFY